MLDRRRLLIANSQGSVRTELECYDAETIIRHGNSDNRDFRKKYDGYAVAASCNFAEWKGVLLVSPTASGAEYRVWSSGVAYATTITYNGETWYVSARSLLVKGTTVDYYPLLNSVLGTTYTNDNAGSQAAAKDLLDYYYGVI